MPRPTTIDTNTQQLTASAHTGTPCEPVDACVGLGAEGHRHDHRNDRTDTQPTTQTPTRILLAYSGTDHTLAVDTELTSSTRTAVLPITRAWVPYQALDEHLLGPTIEEGYVGMLAPT